MPEPRDPPVDRFLGVRLTPEELARLDQFVVDRKLANRSEAIRALLRETDTPRPTHVELPTTRLRELEELVEDGYFSSVAALVDHGVEVALHELVADRDGLAQLRRHAREMRERGERRRRADREGRELLRR